MSELTTRDPTAPDHDAWVDMCRRLERVGARLLDDDFPGAREDRAEGFRHLAQQVVCWLGWSVGYGDPRSPAFQRQNDLVTKWGGPNVDNVYRHARIRPDLRYRIRGRMNSCEQFILAIRAGFMHQPVWGTLKEITASELGIHEGDDFEILLGGDGSDEAFIPLPDGALTASIREYYFDWRPLEPATFTIECLDGADPSMPTPESIAERLAEATAAVEHSIEYWNRYMIEHRDEQARNELAPPMRVAKGLASARYAFCFFDLAPDEALVVESTEPDAPYWSLQLASMAWYESLDFGNRIISLNHRQAELSSDGLLRVVVAHDDPGTPNWLDTEGRRSGLLTYRWFWGTDAPKYETRVVPFDSLHEVVPDGERVVSPDERRRVIDARRAHVAWRFRS